MKILKFYASWCTPCKALTQYLEASKDIIPCPVENIDIDADMETAVHYGVRGVPTMIMVDENNNQVKRLVGMQSLKDLENWFNV